jgi:hypothetical protein
MIFNELGFPPHEGLPFRPGPPTVDGYVEPEPSCPTAEIEGGYTNGAAFDFAGTNIPIGVVQCIRHASQDLLYLGFVSRFDPSFDDNDFVMIVLRPAGPNAAASADDRRLLIRPVSSAAVGASPAAPEIPPFHIRTNRDPFVHPVHAFGRDMSAAAPSVWKDLGTIPNLVVKVRSESSGTANFWSVEVQIPTKKAGANGGGANWVDLLSPFGLYLNIAQVTSQGGFHVVSQSAWPFDTVNPAASALVDPFDNFDADWDAPLLGNGLIVASQASNPAKGVKFQSGAGSIGVLSGGAISGTLDMAVGVNNTLVARLVNTADLATSVEATFRLAEFGVPGTADNSNAAWFTISDSPGLDNVGENPTDPVALTATASGGTPVPNDATLSWTISQHDHDTYKSLWDDQCLWVQLESAAVANIVQSSVRTNLSLIHQMSRKKKKATIDGRGYGPSGTGGGRHKMILHVANMPIPRFPEDGHRGHEVDEGQGEDALRLYTQLYGQELTAPMFNADKYVVGWVSVVNAFRDTGKHLTIGKNKRKHRVIIHGGSYTFVAQHKLEPGETADNIELGHWLEGGGIKYKGGGVYELEVPVDGKVTLTNNLEPQPAGTGQDPAAHDPWWLRLLKWLIGLFKKAWAWIKSLF